MNTSEQDSFRYLSMDAIELCGDLLDYVSEYFITRWGYDNQLQELRQRLSQLEMMETN